MDTDTDLTAREDALWTDPAPEAIDRVPALFKYGTAPATMAALLAESSRRLEALVREMRADGRLPPEEP